MLVVYSCVMASLFPMMVVAMVRELWHGLMVFTPRERERKNRLLENLCTHAFAITHMCIEFENEGGTFTRSHTSECVCVS